MKGSNLARRNVKIKKVPMQGKTLKLKKVHNWYSNLESRSGIMKLLSHEDVRSVQCGNYFGSCHFVLPSQKSVHKNYEIQGLCHFLKVHSQGHLNIGTRHGPCRNFFASLNKTYKITFIEDKNLRCLYYYHFWI